jgi:cell division protein FtsI (penicillin-binding protein 3)
MTERSYKIRVFFVILILMGVWIGLGVRLFCLHLCTSDEMREKIVKWRCYKTKIPYRRGRILDRNGQVLAMDVNLKDICANPNKIHQINKLRTTTAVLARFLDMPPEDIFRKLNRPSMQEVYVKKAVDRDVSENLKQAGLKGIYFRNHFVRSNPQESIMSHVLGFADYRRIGVAGIERIMNEYLKGKEGIRIGRHNAARQDLYDRRRLDLEPEDGANVYLTLDLTIQTIVEDALSKAIKKHRAKGGWVIVQKVETGEILAMASYPTYNPNHYGKAKQSQLLNRAIGYCYEPGSTLKVLVIAAALNEKKVYPNQMIDCENGYWMYMRRPLRDFHAYDKLTVSDVIKKSSNIGAAKIAIMLGEKRLDQYLRLFGLGEKTGIDLPGEQKGILRPVSKWSGLSISRLAMGHELSITALHMINIISAIANDGYLMRPYVVQKVMDNKGNEIYKAKPTIIHRPIKAEVATVMRRLLTRVTEEGGTGKRAALEDIPVAGKTGTAQKYVNGVYSGSAHVASFSGFVPADDPQISIIVVVDEPQPIHTGGYVAAPVFKEIAQQALGCIEGAQYTKKYKKKSKYNHAPRAKTDLINGVRT